MGLVKLESKSFTGGIITEASPLLLPDGASIDEQNFVINSDGSRERRKGIDATDVTTELTDSQYETLSGDVMNHVWYTNDGNKLIVYFQKKTNNPLVVLESDKLTPLVPEIVQKEVEFLYEFYINNEIYTSRYTDEELSELAIQVKQRQLDTALSNTLSVTSNQDYLIIINEYGINKLRYTDGKLTLEEKIRPVVRDLSGLTTNREGYRKLALVNRQGDLAYNSFYLE